MELLTSLPAELVAFADPSARGPAPLLRPADADAGSGAVPASFDACLALLGIALPAGEAWPLTGKELPAVPVSGAAAEGQVLDADALASGAADAALLARLRLATAAAPATDAPEARVAAAFPAIEADASTVLASSAEPAGAPSVVPDLHAAVDLEAAAVPPAPDALPLDTAEPAAPIPPAESADLPSWLDTLAARDERAPRTTPAQGDARLPSAAAAAAVPAQAAAAAQPTAEVAAIARDAGLRNTDAPNISPASGVTSADAPGVPRPEWLPAGHSSATNAVSAPAAPATPVDVRSPGWQEAFANRVQMLVDSNVNEARITLHPPELGAVDIEISLVDDKTFVQLTTATAAARDELSHSLPRLRELFTVSGLELGGAGVHHGRDGYGAGRGEGGPAASPRYFAPLADLGDDVPVVARSRPAGRIDVFA